MGQNPGPCTCRSYMVTLRRIPTTPQPGKMPPSQPIAASGKFESERCCADKRGTTSWDGGWPSSRIEPHVMLAMTAIAAGGPTTETGRRAVAGRARERLCPCEGLSCRFTAGPRPKYPFRARYAATIHRHRPASHPNRCTARSCRRGRPGASARWQASRHGGRRDSAPRGQDTRGTTS